MLRLREIMAFNHKRADFCLPNFGFKSSRRSSFSFILEYNIQVLTIETTVRKPSCIRVQITAVTSAFYFMPVLCVLYSKTLKR